MKAIYMVGVRADTGQESQILHALESNVECSAWIEDVLDDDGGE